MTIGLLAAPLVAPAATLTTGTDTQRGHWHLGEVLGDGHHTNGHEER